MEKSIYFHFRKVGFKRNKILFLYSGFEAPLYEKFIKKYGESFYITKIKK